METLELQISEIYKKESARLLAVLVRIFGPSHFDLAEDVLQDAFSKALVHWREKMPGNPSGWIVQTAKNAAIDALRTQNRTRDFAAIETHFTDGEWTPEQSVEEAFRDERIQDDQLRMIFMCCHESVKAENRIPLILKTLCGFTIPAISRALVVPETTIKKRLYRTRESLRNHTFAIPPPHELPLVMDTVHTVLYLLFSEGFHSSNPKNAQKVEFCRDALALVRLLVADPRIANRDTLGLFALMHFQMARMAARLDEAGNVIPMNLQDRSLWKKAQLKTAVAMLNFADSVRPGPTGRFLIEARIAKEHCLAASFEQTDWQAIVALYEDLVTITQSPVAELNLAIAIGYSGQLNQAIDKVTALCQNKVLKKSHMTWATLAHFHAMAGHRDLAHEHARLATELGGTPHEHRVMMQQLERLLS